MHVNPTKKGSARVSKSVSVIMIVLTNWTFHNQSQKQQTDKDFAALNRLAIKNKVTNCREQYDFRQTVNARLRDPNNRREFGSGMHIYEN